MIQEALSLNLTDIPVNGTRFEQVSAIAQQPYFIIGMIFIFLFMLLLWFLFSFSRISEKSDKLCWSSWINIRSLIYLLIGAILYIFIFVFPLPTYFS